MTKALEPTPLKKAKLPHGQKTFDRLKEKVASLQSELTLTEKYLDDSLSFYFGHYIPLKNELARDLEDLVAVLFHHYKHTKLTNKEHQLLKEYIENKIHEILCYIHFSEASKDLLDTYKTLTGKDYKDTYCEQFDTSLNDIQQLLREKGLDINLDHINKFDTEDEILRSILESVKDSALKTADQECGSNAKDRQELKREEKKKVLESIQAKTMSNIYKRLAKAFHPDLEQSNQRKEEKVQQMKKLTLAYKEQDLPTLLRLESEWLTGTNEHIDYYSPQNLKIFNSILKEQIDDIEFQLSALHLQPKYFDIHAFITPNVRETIVKIKNAIIELRAKKEVVAQITEDLKGKNAKSSLQDGLRHFEMSLKGNFEDILSDLFQEIIFH